MEYKSRSRDLLRHFLVEPTSTLQSGAGPRPAKKVQVGLAKTVLLFSKFCIKSIFRFAEPHTKMAKSKQKGKGPRRSSGGPSFNEDALEKLTSRIDQNLSENDNKRKRPPTNASPAQTAKKQRNSDASPATNGSKTDQEALLAEILALGGNEDDLELINGVDSDDEVVNESKAPVDKKLRDELAALSKELGFAGLAPQEASEEEEEEDEEDEDEEDEEEDEEDEREDEKIPESRKMGNMVCRFEFK